MFYTNLYHIHVVKCTSRVYIQSKYALYQVNNVLSLHLISGNSCQETGMKCQLMVQTGMKYNNNCGLYRVLNVAVGHLYAVSFNLKTGGGLIHYIGTVW